MATKFRSLNLRNWRQFRSVNIDVHDRATIITGANGAGKSTILGLFGQHLGFQRPLVGTPTRKVGGAWQYDTGFFDVSDEENKLDEPFLPFTQLNGSNFMQPGMSMPHIDPGSADVGRVGYSNGVTASINAPRVGNAYGTNINPMQQVPGVYLSSHRVVAPYQQVANLSLQVSQVDMLYGNYLNEVAARYNGHQTNLSPLYRVKEAILSLAAFGQGNDYLDGNPQLLEVTREFEALLRIMLPEELGFISFSVRMPDIVLTTKSGDFVLDASSGGISAVFELTWQLLLYSKTQQAGPEFVIVMDEPENHLHPSMQRTLLPKMLQAFPQAQLIIATHSPFVVSSVEDSNVYALRYRSVQMSAGNMPGRQASRVIGVPLTKMTKAGSAADILREVLGVPVTFPDWANDRVDAIVQSLSGTKLDKAAVDTLRSKLADAGLQDYFPEALENLVGSR